MAAGRCTLEVCSPDETLRPLHLLYLHEYARAGHFTRRKTRELLCFNDKEKDGGKSGLGSGM